MLITCENITKSYTDKILLDNQTITVGANDKIGIIGVNGCGKSTLLKIMAKLEEPDTGDVSYERFKKITYLGQELNLDEENTPLEQVLLSFTNKEKEEKEHEAKSMLLKLGVSDINKQIKYLSGGEKRKVSIASSLVKESDCLLIDEITNHLDSETINFLEKYLIKFNKAIVMVTHDRYFLERVTKKIVEIYRGKLYFYEGSYSRFLELKAQRMEYAIAAERKRQAFLRKEYEWIKRGALARTTKSKKRIENYYETLDKEFEFNDGKDNVVITLFWKVFEKIYPSLESAMAPRLSDNYLSLFVLAIFCGLLMYTAVEIYKTSNSVYGMGAILLCVSVFILSGYEHSIANMAYFTLYGWSLDLFIKLIVITIGNSIGGMFIPVCKKIME